MSDWIKHDGTCCPVPVGTWCWRKYADGSVELSAVHPTADVPVDEFGFSLWFWEACRRYRKWSRRIIAYRLPRSRAADEMIERVRNLPVEELA